MRTLATVVVVMLAAGAHAQPTAAPARPSPTRPPLVIRSGVDVVRIDAVVTDGKDRHVTDLKAEDFEIFEDGRKKELSHCEYVSSDEPTQTTAAAPTPTPRPGAPLKREEVRRATAIVVDDLGIGFSDIQGVRNGLKKFVEQDMRPGDLVAIVRASGGTGVLQQFTADKDILRAAVSQIRWNGLSVGGTTAREGADALNVGAAAVAPIIDPGPGLRSVEALRRQSLIMGTLGALEYVIEGLSAFPGRKSVLFFSSNLSLRDYFEIGSNDPELPQFSEEIDGAMVGALRRVTDLANRASVAVYTVDPRGVGIPGMTGAAIKQFMQNRQETQAGLHTMAEETGGFFIGHSNDMSWAVRRVVADQQGYYLLGYVTDAGAKTGPRGVPEHRVKVKVKRPGLDVRTRSRYAGSLDAEPAPPSSSTDQLIAAAASPFAVSELALRLTPTLLRSATSGHLVRVYLHVDGHGLSYEDDARPGMRHARVLVTTATFGEKGVAGETALREVTMPFPAEREEQFKAAGLLLEMDVPVQKPGYYQVRGAVRDVGSGRQGAAQAFLLVPEIKKDWLAMSGIILSGVAADGESVFADPYANPARRNFRPGSDVLYAFVAYGTKSGTDAPARLETELRLFRENSLLASEKSPTVVQQPQRARPARKGETKALEEPGECRVGSFHLSPAIEPGDYSVEVRVVDPDGKASHNVAAQRIGFEVVPATAATANGLPAAR